MPPLLLGLPGDATFRNFEEANRAFWRQTVIPMVARLLKSFHAWLQPGFAPFRFDYNADRIDALARERQMEWSRIGAASFLTQDEQREAVGYGPLQKPPPGAKPWGRGDLRAGSSPTNWVAVVLEHDPKAPKGFRLITAWPFNK